jgi:hypothetical protein
VSKASAVAVVTAALVKVMTERIEVAEGTLLVTALPPDMVEQSENRTQLNIYLYQVTPNAAHRNAFSTYASAADGEGTTVHVAPLALNLHYLLSVHRPAGELHWDAQRVLAEAMSLLNSQPLLNRKLLRDVSGGTLEGAGLDLQPERVRFTPHVLSLDDAYKIWSGFQTPYRLSVAYEASVILIDPGLDGYRAQPVLARGSEDQGGVVMTGVLPRLDAVRYPSRLKTAHVGGFAPAAVEIRAGKDAEEISLVGAHLITADATVQFRPAGGGDWGVIERPAIASGDTVVVPLTKTRDEAKTRIPDKAKKQNPDSPRTAIEWTPETDPADEPDWNPGFYIVTFVENARSDDPKDTRISRLRSNSLVVPVVPRFVGDPTLKVVGKDGKRSLVLECTVEPGVRPNQRLTAIVRNLSTSTVSTEATDKLKFTFASPGDLRKGDSVRVRLRVDEVENLALTTRKNAAGESVVPTFDSDSEVKIQ